MTSTPKSITDSHPEEMNLLDLPPEVLQLTISRMDQGTQAQFMRACRQTYDLTLPALYRSRATKRGTMDDVAALPDLFLAQPDLIPLVRELIIDEYHPVAVRRLLSISFPNLTKLFIRHVGPVEKEIPEEEKVLLNQSLKKQPRLNDLSFSIKGLSRKLAHTLTINDVPLFDHPTLTRLSLFRLNLTPWTLLPASTFHHTHLDTLCLEYCLHPARVLDRLISPSKCLSHMRLRAHPFQLSLSHLSSTLSPCIQSLKILKLRASYRIANSQGLDLRNFTALLFLQISPELLLGSHYQTNDFASTTINPNYVSVASEDLHTLIGSYLPPNLRVLSLDDLFPTSHNGSTAPPVPPVVAFDANAADSTVTALPVAPILRSVDRSIIKSILRNHDAFCPKLFAIYNRNSPSKPSDGSGTGQGLECYGDGELYDLSEKTGVDLMRIWHGEEESHGGPMVDWIEDSKPRRLMKPDTNAKDDKIVQRGRRCGGIHGRKYCWCYLSWRAWDSRERVCRLD